MKLTQMPQCSVLGLVLCLGVSTACSGDADKSDTADDDTGSTIGENGIPYGDGENQWLNLYLAESDTPTPVYIFSHANGGTADSVGGFVMHLQDVGISTISWESVVLPDGSPEDLETGWSDAELMLSWLKDNADGYNIDADRIIMGGRSRGSVFSWQLAHSQEPAIKGIYMFQALPDGIWANPDMWTPIDNVTENSPPIKLTYKEAPGTDDGHKPEHGLAIVERYEELGIGDQAEVEHSLGAEAQLYHDIAEWCTALLEM